MEQYWLAAENSCVSNINCLFRLLHSFKCMRKQTIDLLMSRSTQCNSLNKAWLSPYIIHVYYKCKGEEKCYKSMCRLSYVNSSCFLNVINTLFTCRNNQNFSCTRQVISRMRISVIKGILQTQIASFQVKAHHLVFKKLSGFVALFLTRLIHVPHKFSNGSKTCPVLHFLWDGTHLENAQWCNLLLFAQNPVFLLLSQ